VTRFASVLGALIVGGLGIAIDRYFWKNAITLLVESGGELSVIPKKGDVISWTDSAGVYQTILFPLSTPCREGNKITRQCTVIVKSGYYNYECAGCIDPAIDFGNDTYIFGASSTTRTESVVRTGPPGGETVSIYCDSTSGNRTAGYKNPISASKGYTVQWHLDGSPTKKDWTVAFDTQICNEGKNFNQGVGSQVCTLMNNLTSGSSYPYTVQAGTCSGGAGTGTIGIQ
jgi:hypothetical protein